MQRIIAKKPQGDECQVDFAGIPDTCPLCHSGIEPIRQAAVIHELRRGVSILQVVYQCPKETCRRLFIAAYFKSYRMDYHSLDYVEPRRAQEKSFDQMIRDLSPQFVEIYNQALVAEAKDLTQLVGTGLRKALEFLVKDFVISRNKEREVEIRKTWLAHCIEEFIEDPRVKACAKRAAWLGNDEVHYYRRWEDKDVEDLKVLIKLTVNWIESDLLTEKYANDMPD